MRQDERAKGPNRRNLDPAKQEGLHLGMHVMTITPEEIEAEHTAALAALTPDQRRALERLANARQRTNFNGRFPRENLKAIFEAEAQARSRAVAA